MKKLKEIEKKKITDILAAISLMIAAICASVLIVLNFTPLYVIAVDIFEIARYSGYKEDAIIENYRALIAYNQIFGPEKLEFDGLAMSNEGRIHFEEVKEIFVFFQIVALVVIPFGLIVTITKVRRGRWGFLKLAGLITIIFPIVLGGAIGLNWEWAFVTFHEIAFDNDYWIFNPITDPVINILPEDFFMLSATMIVLLIFAFAGGMLGLYRILKRKAA